MVPGGKRPGAGRPPLPEGKRKVAVLVHLPPGILAWLDEQQESRGVLIEKALRQSYKITETEIGGDHGKEGQDG